MFDAQKLIDAVGDLDENLVYRLLDELLEADKDKAQDAMAACQEGMQLVGSRFEQGEYFIGDLIFAGEVMQGAVQRLKPMLITSSGDTVGKMILCTVEGDLHDIGKNIVRSFLEASGFEIVDLGIDVPAARIIETAKTENIKIIGLSGVLTLAIDAMKQTVRGFIEAGMRDDVRIIVGGSPINAAACDAIGADAWAHNPQAGADICLGWVR